MGGGAGGSIGGGVGGTEGGPRAKNPPSVDAKEAWRSHTTWR